MVAAVRQATKVELTVGSDSPAYIRAFQWATLVTAPLPLKLPIATPPLVPPAIGYQDASPEPPSPLPSPKLP